MSRSKGDRYFAVLMECEQFFDELGAKNVKCVDRPEFGLVLVQLDIEMSLIGKFHWNPPSSFWRDAIGRKIKDGRRWPCFFDRSFFFFFFFFFFVLFFLFCTCTTRHRVEHSDQDLKENPTSGLGGDAITSLSMGNFTVNGKSPSREPNGQICRRTGIFFYSCTFRHWGKRNRQVSFESVK